MVSTKRKSPKRAIPSEGGGSFLFEYDCVKCGGSAFAVYRLSFHKCGGKLKPKKRVPKEAR